MVDVVDADGERLDRVASLDEVNDQGLWHLGVHILIYSRDGKVLVQKRAKGMVYHPGMLDLSIGGAVDAGETPETAAVREIREECGIICKQNDLVSLGSTRYNHRWPKYRKHSRVIVHSFALVLPSSNVELQLQRDEVSEAQFISLRRAKRLLFSHRLRNLGRIMPRYSYYRKLLNAATNAAARSV